MNSIFADVKSIIELSRRHFFADVKEFEGCLLKKSISEINSNTDVTEDSITETTNLSRKQIEFIFQENASKNTMINILAENQHYANNTKEVNFLRTLKTIKGTFINNRYKPKSQSLVCSNQYDTLYPTVGSDELYSSSDAKTFFQEAPYIIIIKQ